MSNPILRAGPFRFGSNSFSADNDDPECNPVNCANARSARWPWRVRKVADGTPSANEMLISGVSSFENSFSTSSDLPFVSYRFAYQAAIQWSFNGSTYSASADEGFDNPVEVGVVVVVGIDSVFSDSDEGSGIASIAGNFDSIVFPASIVPRFVEITFSGGTGSGVGSVLLSGSLDLPIVTP